MNSKENSRKGAKAQRKENEAYETQIANRHKQNQRFIPRCLSCLCAFAPLRETFSPLLMPAVRAKKWFALLLVSLALLSNGCKESIDTAYGRRSGVGASQSVNGTGVLAAMFQQAGHRVFSWHALSPRLDAADCIVWFPDDFQAPSFEVCQWLRNWLAHGANRAVVYVGRDFDAAPGYWKKILPLAPPAQQEEIRRRLAIAEGLFNVGRQALAPTPSTSDKKSRRRDRVKRPTPSLGSSLPLFDMGLDETARQVRTLGQWGPWSEGVDEAKLEIELRRRLVPLSGVNANVKYLLGSGDDLLAWKMDVEQGQLIAVANGSFLLNLPLVNHEHRKLAAHLIDEIGTTSQSVAFLESGPDGPPIREKDPSAETPTGLELLSIWPTNFILLHLMAAGVLACFWRWPIFGRPRPLAPEALSDFGKHIDALAELLRRSGDRGYASARLAHYRQKE